MYESIKAFMNQYNKSILNNHCEYDEITLYI